MPCPFCDGFGNLVAAGRCEGCGGSGRATLATLIAWVRETSREIRADCLGDGLTSEECTPRACVAMPIRDLRNRAAELNTAV